jgi:mannose-1-phosphate guanylyltransferase
VIPVVLSGGSGSRLWPLSRKKYPKQFLSVVGGELSLFQQTLSRLNELESASSPIIIANQDHRFLVVDQLDALGAKAKSIVLEPFGRNTAPAITLAALQLHKEGKSDELMLVLAADHVINSTRAFVDSVTKAERLAKKGYLVTFGVVPDFPETGYGYIKAGDSIDSGYIVDQFVEKPDREVAQKYVSDGSYLWNSGMFLFSAKTYLDEMKMFSPEMLEICDKALIGGENDLDFLRIKPDVFERVSDVSVDVALMEKTDKATCVKMDAGWSDVGVWSSVWSVRNKDTQGNATHGDDIYLHESKNNLIHGGRRTIATLGVRDLVIVDTKDALLVMHKDASQGVKRIVEDLKEERCEVTDLHREVHRPWGIYDSVDQGHRYQVKKITVKPGASLSMQKHYHRAEHWIVVKGTAKVKCGDKEMLLTENQSTYIPLGTVHQLSNPGKIPLELIEVQSGDYLGEDDIVRFEDSYGRGNDE